MKLQTVASECYRAIIPANVHSKAMESIQVHGGHSSGNKRGTSVNSEHMP